MADLSDARLRSMRKRAEALERWAKTEDLSLPDGIRETMELAADDINALLDERLQEGDRGNKNRAGNEYESDR